MPLIVGQHEAINGWIASKGGGRAAPTTYQCLGWSIDRPPYLVGGIAFSNYNGVSCHVNIALEPDFNPRGLITAGLTYAFGQLALRRLTLFILSSNIRSIAFAEALGAIREATLSDAEPTGDLHIYALRPDSCLIWKRIRGKSLRSAARP